jgi:hypothetical protein
MGQFQPPADPSTVWLRSLVDAMDEVTASAAKASAIDREALANRLELPAMPAPPGVRPPAKQSSKGLGDSSQAQQQPPRLSRRPAAHRAPRFCFAGSVAGAR